MKLTIMAGADRFMEVEVDPGEMVEGVKALVEAETGVAVLRQKLLFEGRELSDSQSLSVCGVKDADMLVMVEQASDGPRSRPGRDPMSLVEDGSAADPEAFRVAVLADRALFARLSQVNPLLARAIETGELEEIQRMLRRQRDMVKAEQRKHEEDSELLIADPFDPEAQAKIEERIRQENIDLNYEVALEHNPEQFVAVHMLYVEMVVNRHPIKAFVDSGAQTTIMSLACAERCSLMRLVDKRFHGTAVGVGTSKIVGIIHAVPLQIGPNFYSCRISVLENIGTDFLFGLDMLRRHQCCIDLKANVLSMGGGEITVPFLEEKDCPKREEADMAEAPPHEGTTTADASASRPSTSAPAGSPAAASSGAAAGVTEGTLEGVHGQAPAAAQQVNTGSKQERRQGREDGWEEKLRKLVELGFTREQAHEALMLTNGNEEQAAGLLFQGL